MGHRQLVHMFEATTWNCAGVVDASRYLHHLDTFWRGREAMAAPFAVAAVRRLRRARAAASPRARARVLTRRFELPEARPAPPSAFFLDEATRPASPHPMIST